MITQGIYEHYKSMPEHRMYYQVLFLSHNEPDLEVLVHYVPLYKLREDKQTDDDIAVWTRTLKNFAETVEYNGKTVPRFTKISSTIDTWVKRQ